ncbi:MAG TPA: hypothetical protein VFS13_03950 [Steroidobacteraceae bacterium]|nr:hypothetical protein [Steroidobacteraceae bacterium]
MFSRDAQHTAVSEIATPPLTRIIWQTPVDLAPQYFGGGQYLLTHYGSPIISSMNTVLVPVKTGAQGGFRFEARSGTNGVLMWSATSDYIVPPHNWFPSFNLTLTANGRVYAPGAGGKIYFRDNVDSLTGTVQTAVFYGANVYAAARAELDAAVMISTPITVDAAGNAFFGFYVNAANSAGLSSGVARLAANGTGTWQPASTLASDATMDRVAMNSAPALTTDGATLYVAVSNAQERGYLLALDSATLAPMAKVQLLDPKSGAPARIPGDGTASPTIGPDGDVYFGVLEAAQGSNNSRGWLLHFDATLSQGKIPGAFGWDDTATVVPASSVPSYAGTSAYLLATKYNNYAGSGTGDGLNRMALLDPAAAHTDPISGVQTMAEVFTILGPTADADHPGGVREWCVNTAAFDPATRSMLVNNEDGYMYRWNLETNTLSERLRFNNGLGQSYTPTAVGADGTVYAINNAVLFAVGR